MTKKKTTPKIAARYVRPIETSANVIAMSIPNRPTIEPKYVVPNLAIEPRPEPKYVTLSEDERARMNAKIAAGRMPPHVAEAMTVMANEIAREEHEDHFESRRGLGHMTAGRGLPAGFFLYDNNPYGDDPVRPFDAAGTRRGREHAELIAFMATRGCTLAARGSYPTSGDEDEGYTVALVFVSATSKQADADECAASERWQTIVGRALTTREAATANAIESLS